MYKFKYKAQGEDAQTFYFEELQEVFDYIGIICESTRVKDILKMQKEFNIRFYIKQLNK